MTGKLGETVSGIAVAGDLLYTTGSISGQIRVYDLATKRRWAASRPDREGRSSTSS
jgi:hypothetical protein